MSNIFAVVIDVRIWGSGERKAMNEVRRRLNLLYDRGSVTRHSVKRAVFVGGKLRNHYDVYAVVEAESKGALYAALVAEFGDMVGVGFEVLTSVKDVSADLSAVA